MRIAARDGVEIYAEAHGEGIPVVFSCAFLTTHENFRAQVDPLVAAGARVILWDYRGHGASDAPPDPAAYTLDAVVDDLGRVLDWAAPGQRVVAAGLSLGGLVSLHFALRNRDRVRALLLIDSGPGFKSAEGVARWASQTERTAFMLEQRGMATYLEGKAGTLAVGRRRELPAARAAAAAIEAQDEAALARFGREVVAGIPGVIDDLTSLDLPALVLVGEEDDAYLKAAEVLAARLPQAEKLVLPHAGHVCNLEEPDAFNAAVGSFLASLPAEPGS